MRRTCAALCLGLLTLTSQSLPSRAEAPALLGFGIGQFDQDLVDPGLGFFDVSESGRMDEALDLRLEYRFGTALASFFGDRAALHPFAGIEATTDGSVYGLGGIVLDVRLGSVYLAPSFGLGLFVRGDGKDLGSPLEFRSQIEGGWVFESGYRLGLAYSHISNAGIDDVNPGSNIISLYLHAPVSALFGE